MVLHAVQIMSIHVSEVDPPFSNQQFHLGAELSFQLTIVGIAGVEVTIEEVDVDTGCHASSGH